MTNIGDLLTKINLRGEVKNGVPLAQHTTFKAGGPADWMVFPKDIEDVKKVRTLCRRETIPLFVLGKGANLLVSDKGIRGVTLNLSSLEGGRFENDGFRVLSGTDVGVAVESCRDKSLSSLEFLYGMPSSIGGAVWMNARCYGAEIADVFQEALILDEEDQERSIPFDKRDWDYKVSPFQGKDWLILEALFRTKPANYDEIEKTMKTNYSDRESKGHFRLPCAGSVFKNNRAFGEPSGVIIDRCELKGLRRGKAVVSAWHANIIVNEGNALAADIRDLIHDVKNRVLEKTGFLLEEEVIYAGEW